MFDFLFPYTPKKPQSIIREVPYFAQWESPRLAKRFLATHSVKTDPEWRLSGAKTKDEYELWSWNGCGMACLKMILQSKFNKTPSLIALGKKCLSYGGYIPMPTELKGLYYQPFIKFIHEEFNLHGRVIKHLSLNGILKSLEKQQFVIASVAPQIRNSKAKPSKRGGHLILLLGYDHPQKLLYFHNPSGGTPKTQQYVEITYTDFARFFAGRGIVIS